MIEELDTKASPRAPNEFPIAPKNRNGKQMNGRHSAAVLEESKANGHFVSERAVFPVPTTSRQHQFMERVEAFISTLSTKNNFWHRICSWLWLPFAFSSGIRMNSDGKSFTAVLPFRRFNRNWYSAMAGAVLLGNSEIAGGMYVFKECGRQHRVVCKKVEYRFLRPCVGPALYRMAAREDIQELAQSNREFNVTVDITIAQLIRSPKQRERRVGKCTAIFHAAPIVPDEKFKRRQGVRPRVHPPVEV